jgi:signal transduction histidine kinase/CheY-like chemotaxis protein
MRQQKQHTTIRYKVTISYLLLVLLAVAAVSVLYNGIHNIILLDTSTANPNYKLKQINQILTDVYEAEGFSRSYFLFRNDTDLVQYIQTTDKISKGIDLLKILCKTDTSQIRNLNGIDGLLNQKKGIINQLVEINRNNLSDLSYSRVIDEVYLNSFDNVSQPLTIKATTNVRRDSLFLINGKNKFFNKVKNIFTSTKKIDNKQFSKTTVDQYTTYDTIYQPVEFPDSLLKTLKQAINNFKHRNDFVKQQSVSQETQLLHSDRIILGRIRSIVASLETEEFIHTSSFLDKSRVIIRRANYSVIVLGVFALLLVFIFLIIIYRDIARTRAYQLELMKARQYSEDLVKLKEQFVATISHEIRTPLSAIVGFSEQLKKTDTSESQSVCIENIESASQNLHALVNNILDLSKSNAGKIELESIPFSLKDTIEKIFRTFSNEAEKKGLEFNNHPDESADKIVIGDKYRFSQVISNIVNNAIKFTETGMVDIITKTTESGNGMLQAEIIIFDTGIGIPNEKIHSIFDEFTQANTDTTRKFGGTGLGLSIAHKLITIMGGTIQVNSSEGQGSTFIVQLPLAEMPADKEWKIETINNKDILKDISILVVEDDEALHILMEQLCINNRINGIITHNGNEALDVMQHTKFQIVFTDIQMPGMDGMELCSAIQSQHPEIPVIAFSAQSSLAHTYKEYGFSGYLSKPFTETSFFNLISQILNLSSIITPKSVIAVLPENNKNYSFQLLREFTGKDPESLRLVVQTFIENTTKELGTIRGSIECDDLKNISERIHKLLPMFKQLLINKLIDEMQMIERFDELNLSKSDVVLFAENFIENAGKVVEEIKNDSIFKQD